MSRKWILLTLIFSLGSSGALQANPLDLPGTVYIDGLPCNRACQAYMAWSRPSSARHRGEGETNVVVPVEAELARVEHAVRPRVARQPVPVPRLVPRAGMAASNAKPPNARPSNTKASHSKNATGPKLADQASRKAIPTATVIVTPDKTIKKTVPGTQEPERKPESSGRVKPAQGVAIGAVAPTESPKSEVVKPEVAPAPKAEIAAPPATSEVAALPAATGTAPASAPRTIQQQVAEATGMADRVTALTLERERANNSDNQAANPGDAGDADMTASTSPANPDNLVALVLVRPEINALSDLNNKSIAIEEKQSAASGSVSAALMAAGSAEVLFSEGKTAAVDRLISGEVPAAVLTLASPEAAEWFPLQKFEARKELGNRPGARFHFAGRNNSRVRQTSPLPARAMKEIPSRRRNIKLPRSTIGRVSQANKRAQAKRDSRR